MVFARHNRRKSATESSPLSRAVLLIGHAGQGIGLASDMLNRAAELDGLSTDQIEMHRLQAGRIASGCLTRLWRGDLDLQATTARVDLILALDVTSALDSLPLLKPRGHALVYKPSVAGGRCEEDRFQRTTNQFDSPRWGAIRWIEGPEESPEGSPLEIVLYLLGRASRRLPISRAAWPAALAEHLPADQLVRALDLFKAGRRRPRRGYRRDFD
jgi:Pyruvate/2-oxoacid:ferredoxin oxidoreductase gamma subunit